MPAMSATESGSSRAKGATPAAAPWIAAAGVAASRRSLDAGQPLFRQGDATFGIFAVESGRLRLLRHARDGSDCVLHVAARGDTFAEAALFSPHYHCDAIADIPSRVTVFPKDALLAAFAADTDLAAAFMAHLARQVQALRARVEMRNIRSADERGMRYLALRAIDGAATVTFDRPLRDVAGEIGLAHESFYRALKILETRGAIGRNGRKIRLLGSPDTRRRTRT
jgi:CRP-like cAMP-binding protein